MKKSHWTGRDGMGILFVFLSKLILFGETSLRRVVSEYLQHYHQERNHQGKDNLLLGHPIDDAAAWAITIPLEVGPSGLRICSRERDLPESSNPPSPHRS